MPDLFSIGGGTPDAPAPAPEPAPNLTLPQLGSGAGYVTQDQINAAARAAGVDPDLYTRVVRRESAGNIAAKSAKGALGPAQIMPATAPQGVDITDPVQNLNFGAKYLKAMLDRYGGDQERALAAYNAGPDAVDKARGVPNIPETQAYVSSIMGGGGPDLFALGGGPHGEVPATAYEPGHGVGGPGQPGEAGPPDRQALAYSFLAKNGFYDPKADLGSQTRPAGQVPGQGAPSEPNSWYVTTDGKLRQTGDPTDDYLPQYQHILALRSGVQKSLGPGLTTAAGAGQGLIDIGQSANKLTGGALGGTYEALTGEGFDFAQDAARSLARGQEEQRDYNLLFGGSPYASGGRFFGQAVPVAAATLGTTKGLGALGAPGEFLAGEGGTNLLTQGLSRGTSGAIQGAEAAGLTSSTSDRPLGAQIATGAGLGFGAGVGLPTALGAVQRAATGPALAEGPITDLATVATDKYGIPLRAGQIRGAAGDRAAWTADSNLLGSSPKFAENNNAQKAAFMRGITSTYGDTSGDVSPESLSANQDVIGTRIGAVADRVGSIDAAAVPDRLDAVVKEAGQVLGSGDVAPLRNLVKNIKSTIGPDGTMSAAAYQALTRSTGPLMQAIKSADTQYPGQIKEALDDALQASASPGDVAELQNARFQYKNLMTVAKLAQQGKVDANGFISPALLRGAVASNFKNQAFQGAGDLGQLAQIGQTFMKEPPNSYSANRAADFMSHLGSAGFLSGEALAAYLHNPLLAVGAAAPLALKTVSNAVKQARLGPGATNRLLGNSPLALDNVSPYVLPGAVIGAKNLLMAPSPTVPAHP